MYRFDSRVWLGCSCGRVCLFCRVCVVLAVLRPDGSISEGEARAATRFSSLEPIWQSLATTRSVMSAFGVHPTDGVSPALLAAQAVSIARGTARPDGVREFRVGQWIDCLDTVDQWLPATITEVRLLVRRWVVRACGWF